MPQERLQAALAELIWIVTAAIKGVMIGLFLALILAITVTMSEAAQGDYCLGEWSDEVGLYCKRVAVVSTALAMDRKVGMSKMEALMQTNGLNKSWHVPKRLIRSAITILWDEEHINPETLSPMQFGAVMEAQCIDNYETVITWE